MNNQNEEIEKLANLLDDSKDIPVDKLPILAKVSPKIVSAIKSSQVDNKIYSYKDLAERIILMPEVPKITSGYKEIDYLVEGGWEPGELVILSAPEKMGKTLMFQSMSINQASNGIPVLWFTLEMSWLSITKRFMKMDWEFKTMKSPSKLPIYYPIDNRALSLEWIKSQIFYAKKQYGVQMVYIDHLHYLFSMSEGKKSNISFLVGDIVKNVQEIGKELGVTICLICHMTKTDATVMPSKNDLRDSSFPTQLADHVLILWRETQKRDTKEDVLSNPYLFTNRTILSFELNRRTGETKRMGFGMIDGQFYPWSEYEKLSHANRYVNKNEESFVETKNEINEII